MGLCCDISPANLVLRLPKWAQFANEKQFAFMSVISVKNKHIYSVFIKLNLSILSWKQTREITTYLSKLQLFTFLWHTCWQKLSAWLCIMAQCCHAILRDMDLKIDKVIRVWKWSVLGHQLTLNCLLLSPWLSLVCFHSHWLLNLPASGWWDVHGSAAGWPLRVHQLPKLSEQ